MAEIAYLDVKIKSSNISFLQPMNQAVQEANTRSLEPVRHLSYQLREAFASEPKGENGKKLF